jgi:hypothetical protein
MNSSTVSENPAPTVVPVSPAQRPTTALLAFLKHEWQWSFVIVPYIAAWILPCTWVGYRWTTPSYVLFFQPFIPFLTILLIWARKDRIVRAWNRGHASGERKSGLLGNPLLFGLGIFCLLFAYLVQIKGVAIAGLLIMGWGVVQYIFGWRVLKAVPVALLLSLLVIPIPDSAADMVQKIANATTLRTVSPIFRALKRPAVPTLNKLNFVNGGFAVDYHQTESGAGVIVTALIVVLFYALARRFDGVRTTILLCFTATVGVVLNLLRVFVAGLLGGSSSKAVEWLSQSEIVVLLMGIVVEQWCFSFLQRLMRPQTRHRSDPVSGLSSGVEKLGRAGETMTAPLEQGVRQMGTLLKRSERGIEGAFRKMPKLRFNPFSILLTGWQRSEQIIEKGFQLLFPRKKKRRRR